MRVKIEPLRKTTDAIPQCKKCQGFNHTQKYCSREARCVRCAGKHLTQNCTASKNTPPNCINCKKNHPASYRGCEVAQELQKIRNQQRKSQIQKKRIVEKELPQQTRSNNITNSKTVAKTYVEIIKQKGTTEEITNKKQHTNENTKQKEPSKTLIKKKQPTKVISKHQEPNKVVRHNDSQMLEEILNMVDKLNRRLEEQKDTNNKIFEKFKQLDKFIKYKATKESI